MQLDEDRLGKTTDQQKKKKKGIGNTEVQVIDQYEIKTDIGE